MSDIAIMGGIAADIEGRPDGMLIYADSNPGKIKISYGGVSRNITENLARLGADMILSAGRQSSSSNRWERMFRGLSLRTEKAPRFISLFLTAAEIWSLRSAIWTYSRKSTKAS